MITGTARIIQGNALALPLPDASVDLICTSPPYFGLRSYQDNGQHYEGQIGSEATPTEFLDALIAATREMVRVLKPTGSIFVNLGDKYSGGMGGGGSAGHGGQATGYQRPSAKPINGFPTKSLIGMPWRYAIRCIDELNLILRAEIIWCLSGGARIYARINGKDRPVMLRDLARSYRPESVQLWNGEKWTQVLGWNKTPDDDGALEFELRTGERIGCTPGHQWPTQRGLVRADEIKVGDVIQTTTLPTPEYFSNPLLLPDDDIGWLIGLYIAEGSRSGKTIQFTGHVNETLRHQRLAEIATQLHGSWHVYQTDTNTAVCAITGPVVNAVIDQYVSPGTAKTKHLTLAAWQRTPEFLAAVVEGYLEGDGHYDAKNDRWRIGFCANDEWAADLRTLAARLGAKISLHRATHTGSYGAFPGWRGEWRWSRSDHHNVKPDGQVVAIRASRARDFYDVGVTDEPHLFALASGVLTHNSKPNGLPESVTDRVRRSHEQWFHFTKSPRYFAAVDEIREPQTGERNSSVGQERISGNGVKHRQFASSPDMWNPLGKLPGSVWQIPTQPLTVPAELGVDHFAAYPLEWPRRLIQGWTPNGICVECGEGRRPITAREKIEGTPRVGGVGKGNGSHREGSSGFNAPGDTRASISATITGYTCACHVTPMGDNGIGFPGSSRLQAVHGTGSVGNTPGRPQFSCADCRDLLDGLPARCPECGRTAHFQLPPTTPAVVLDPFGGTGTTALVAKALGRTGISIDLSRDYCRLAEWRCNDPRELAAALQVEKPEPVHPDQMGLFDELEY